MNLERFKIERRKRKLLFLGVIVIISGVFVYWDILVSGSMFALAVQDLQVESSRFEGDSQENSSTPHWVKEKYQDEIENLTKREYYVTQENGTEPPFQNELYDEERAGIYVDIVSGEPLFSSKHKFKSGTGWPSFYKPLEPENIIERKDPGPLGLRVEIASRHARSHLGHLFRNENTPTGLRYCMNSAALKFIPKGELEEKGYGKYKSMFEG